MLALRQRTQAPTAEPSNPEHLHASTWSSSEAARSVLQFAFLGCVLLLVGLGRDATVGLFSGRMGEALRRREWLPKLLDRLAGTIYAGLGTRRIFSDKRLCPTLTSGFKSDPGFRTASDFKRP